jgi:hypothetical protein
LVVYLLVVVPSDNTPPLPKFVPAKEKFRFTFAMPAVYRLCGVQRVILFI